MSRIQWNGLAASASLVLLAAKAGQIKSKDAALASLVLLASSAALAEEPME